MTLKEKILSTGKRALPLIALGGLLFTACDDRGSLILYEREYEGKVNIEVVQEVKTGGDKYFLKVTDSIGNLLAESKTYDLSSSKDIKVVLEDGTVYSTNERGIRK